MRPSGCEGGVRAGRSSGRQVPLRSRRRALLGQAARGGAVSVYIRPGIDDSGDRSAGGPASFAMDTSDLFASCRKGDVGRVR